MPDIKVDGIDGLTVTEHVMPQMEASMKCASLMGMPAAMMIITLPLACAHIWLERWTCDIYYAEITASISLEHEREHCRGKWHDDDLRDYRDRFRSNQERDS